MKAEAKNADTIEITPESHLEQSLIHGGAWTVQVELPKPFEMNVEKLVLRRASGEGEESKGGA